MGGRAGHRELAIAEAGSELEVHVGAYGTTTTELAGSPSRSGIIVSGAVAFAGNSSGDGVAGTASRAFVVDAHEDADGGRWVTVIVDGGVAAGSVAELADQPVIEVDVASTTGVQRTTEITLPVPDGTSLAEAAASSTVMLAGGDFWLDSDAEWFEGADITVVHDLVATTEVDADGGGGGPIEVDAAASAWVEINLATEHKYPGGDMYSQVALDELIAAQTGGSP